jgi:MOSC domain-containing protein YiiM
MSVLSVSLSKSHDFSKEQTSSITLVKGLGVEGDCHAGITVQHRSRLHIKPPPPTLRQVHLIQCETLRQFDIKPSELGENITTLGIDLLALSKGTRLHFLQAGSGSDIKASGAHPVVVITGLRNPCPQIEKFRKGLQEKFIVRDAKGNIVARKAGVMSTVEVGGKVDKGMVLVVETPTTFAGLECV